MRWIILAALVYQVVPVSAATVSPCDAAAAASDRAAALLDKATGREDAPYKAALAQTSRGLVANARCRDVDVALINKGYLLSMRAFAEHHLGRGDWRTDMNQANMLLVRCQTTPGIYGTRTGAECETQEQNNIRAMTDWQMRR